ncbi:hypothetical protein RF11_01252 [Thelohanellus kitauei]|uniref:Uncharacterized protein n=1 Tax=Thelohanellus kitauei TaxID=669202 RepID=A0A0C2NF08_THEKT|nr:hypothetical protein RF11_01252 [Thelohanellus kitauei]
MSRIQILDSDGIQQALDSYINHSQCTSIEIQMEAIKNAIWILWHQYNLKADREFIENFPNEVYEEFQNMSDGETNVYLYQEKKILFFDVFTFIFRNNNLLSDSKAKSFIELFLKFIKTRNDSVVYNSIQLIQSLEFCIKHESNKVLFINENGMFNIYYYLYDVMVRLRKRFWALCESIYDLNMSHRSSLIPAKLSESLSQIMSKFCTEQEIKCMRLLIIVLYMLRRFKLLNEIEIDSNQFYNTTDLIYKKKAQNVKNYTFFNDLSKIWINFLNGSRYKLEIDTIPKLMCFVAIFSNHLSNKLKSIIQSGRKLEVTVNVKKWLYIIYFGLMAYPIIGEVEKKFACPRLKNLHFSLQDYIQKYCLEDFTIENQFIFLQYYIKSHVSLSIPISSKEDTVFEGFLQKLELYPSLSNIFNN